MVVSQPPQSEEDRRRLMAERAEARQSTGVVGISEETQKRLQLNRERDELLGKIRHLCDRVREDPPVGLPTCSIEQLRKYYSELEKRVKIKTLMK